MSKRILVFVYGAVCYAMFLGVFLYAIGFLGNVIVPKSIDSEPQVPIGQALAINFVLLAVFGLQHSVMARPGFKRWWTQYVPKPAERSTYVLFTNVALILLFVFWQPMGGVVWNVENPVGQFILIALFVSGWLIVLVTTFLINHFDLFGLRQVWLYLIGREYTHLRFRTPGPYRYVRHPLYVGWLLAFWATPTMTAAHLTFAAGTTLYILVAIYYEERDLISHFGSKYVEYRKQVPALIPTGRKRARTSEDATGSEPSAA